MRDQLLSLCVARNEWW